MTKLTSTIAILLALFTTVSAAPVSLADRPKSGELQQIFSAVHDGYNLLHLIAELKFQDNIVFAELSGAQQIYPPYTTGDPRHSTNPPRRPRITSFSINFLNAVGRSNSAIPKFQKWEEFVPSDAWNTPHRTTYESLTKAEFDPFAQDGEVAFRFEASKQERARFADTWIVPSGWGAQVEDAVAWRKANGKLFENSSLTNNELEALHAVINSNNFVIRKLAIGLLMRHKAASTENLRAWLRSEPTMIDTAVLVVHILNHDPNQTTLANSEWMLGEDKKLWGGALIGATLVFVENEEAVRAMLHYQASTTKQSQSQTEENEALKRMAKLQPGFDTIESIGLGLQKSGEIRNYPIFSIVNQILSATNVINRASLFFDSSQLQK